jgi:hypothetical protein
MSYNTSLKVNSTIVQTKRSIMNKHMLLILNMRLASSFRKVSACALDHWDMIPSVAGTGI